MTSETRKPTPEQMRAGWEKNPEGAGVAWLENGRVKWIKGLTSVDDVIALVEKLQPPLVVHFRVATEGKNDLILTHPFPLTDNVELTFEGEADRVLFHNGSWGDWRNKSYELAAKKGIKVPDGQWSDSRALAWHAHHMGPSVLEFFNEKALIFGADGIQVFGVKDHNGWDSENGLWFSNSIWKGCLHRYTSPPRQEKQKPQSAAPGGEQHQGPFRNNGGSDRSRQTASAAGASSPLHEQVEGGEETVQERLATSRDSVVIKEQDGAVITFVRRPLINDPSFIAEYRALHGHNPPRINDPTEQRHAAGFLPPVVH